MSTIGLSPDVLTTIYGDDQGWCGLSASAAGATIACPARLALPAARTSSEAADRGTALHEFARVCTVNPDGRAQALLEVPEKYQHTAAGMNLDAALDGLQVVGCEKAYALNVQTRTCRYIGENIDRDYEKETPLSRYEIPFSIDVEGLVDVVPVELDYKSGQSIGDPAEHWQRRICATGLMIFHDTPTAISRVAYIWDDGSIHPDGCEFSILGAEDFCDTLVKTIDAVWEARRLFASGVMPAVNPSDEACQYCPAMQSCPYWTNYAKGMLGRLEAVEKGPDVSELTADEKSKLWDDLKKAEKVVEHTLKALKAMAIQSPFPVGDGYEVRAQSKSRTYFDDSKARGLIVTLLAKTGTPEEEIQKTLKGLHGKTEFKEVRRLKLVG